MSDADAVVEEISLKMGGNDETASEAAYRAVENFAAISFSALSNIFSFQSIKVLWQRIEGA